MGRITAGGEARAFLCTRRAGTISAAIQPTCVRRPGEQQSDTDALVLDVVHNKPQLQHVNIKVTAWVLIKKEGKPLPTIVKFASYGRRNGVFRAKRFLAKSGVTIREELALLHVAIAKCGLHDVWTGDVLSPPVSNCVRSPQLTLFLPILILYRLITSIPGLCCVTLMKRGEVLRHCVRMKISISESWLKPSLSTMLVNHLFI
ncbi:hypothetical protein PR048_023206 [Dryococelus australis]|uniref:Uncharacterized protein n=1 Tax=Dryococelus australis TaxID=614101 RepID=A0ABQ9GTE6_9NEOP|nr:hypothetical protein PR048_023206 [Dryococelus australis]